MSGCGWEQTVNRHTTATRSPGPRWPSLPARLVEWPLRCGPVPPLADCHSPRPETGLGRIGKLDPGDTLILVPGPDTAPSGIAPSSGRPACLAASGGTGKTQLAAALAHQLWDSRGVDLLVWVKASSRNAVLAGYALTLAELGAAEAGDDLLTGAQRFLAWLSSTERRWLVVLDDLADPADLDGLWPAGNDGRVVVTARRDDILAAPDRRIAPVPAFSTREALAYLSARLATDPGQRTEALDLAHDLECQPLALAHATAALICTGASCRDYRGWYHDRKRRISSASLRQRRRGQHRMGRAGSGRHRAGPHRTGLRRARPCQRDLVAGHGPGRPDPARRLRPARPRAGRPARPGRHPRDRLHHPGRLRLPDRRSGHARRACPGPRRGTRPRPGRAGHDQRGQHHADRAGPSGDPGHDQGNHPGARVRGGRPVHRGRAAAVLAPGPGSAPAGPGPAGLHGQPARVRRRSALDPGDPPGPAASGPEPGQR